MRKNATNPLNKPSLIPKSLDTRWLPGSVSTDLFVRSFLEQKKLDPFQLQFYDGRKWDSTKRAFMCVRTCKGACMRTCVCTCVCESHRFDSQPRNIFSSFNFLDLDNNFQKFFCSMSHQPAFMKLCDEIGAETFAPLIIFQMTNWLSRKHRKMWSFKKFNFSSWDTYISLWNIAKFYLDLSLSKYF